MKELRIQAVKQGFDPTTISLNDEALIRKRMDESKITFSTENLNQSNKNCLRNLIENSTKLMQRKTNFNHSKVAQRFIFENFRIMKFDYKKHHRFDFLREKNQNKIWKIQGIKGEDVSAIKRYEKKRENNFQLEEVSELVDSFEIFKNRKRLSCKSDPFILFEYIEEFPLLMSNTGMNSKLFKYVYPDRVMDKIKSIDSSISKM